MPATKSDSHSRVLARNRQAAHNYHFLERFEAGIELAGTEVKSIREGKATLRESYAAIKNEEAWLFNCHVTAYPAAGRFNHEALRVKKLLLHKREIRRLIGRTREKGCTLIPLQLYLEKNRVKCELALAKGKKVEDRRETLRRRTILREAEQAVRDHQRR
jgi:SsrA-binding protein